MGLLTFCITTSRKRPWRADYTDRAHNVDLADVPALSPPLSTLKGSTCVPWVKVNNHPGRIQGESLALVFNPRLDVDPRNNISFPTLFHHSKCVIRTTIEPYSLYLNWNGQPNPGDLPSKSKRIDLFFLHYGAVGSGAS